MEDIKSTVMAELWKIPKGAFCQCFWQCKDSWIECLCLQGSYWEGD
jgi:hypothetical protein